MLGMLVLGEHVLSRQEYALERICSMMIHHIIVADHVVSIIPTVVKDLLMKQHVKIHNDFPDDLHRMEILEILKTHVHGSHQILLKERKHVL